MKEVEPTFDLFSDSPYIHSWKGIGIIVMVAWLPLLLFSFFHRLPEFFMDASVHVRFLIALPLLLFSPYLMKKKFRNLSKHFIDGGLIPEVDKEKFYSYVHRTHELRNSKLIIVLIWLISFVGIILVMTYTQVLASTWRMIGENGANKISPGGLWFGLVSQPIFTFYQLYFIYQALLWWRFLFLVSRLDLRVKTTHGDDSGGLIFLSASVKGFKWPVMALSISAAGGIGNLVIRNGIYFDHLKLTVAILVLLCLFMFVAPLLLFHRPLVRVKNAAILKYGRLGTYQLSEFEKKWLVHPSLLQEGELLQSPDFSSVADSMSVINKAFQMRTVPFTRATVIRFVLCIVLPFLPLLATSLPWEQIFQVLIGLVM